MPFVVTDAVDARGYPTTAGTSFVSPAAHALPALPALPAPGRTLTPPSTQLAAERPAEGDAPCVAALRQAGAMLVGKANLHEVTCLLEPACAHARPLAASRERARRLAWA